jgi:biopolymer transport protein ExbD
MQRVFALALLLASSLPLTADEPPASQPPLPAGGQAPKLVKTLPGLTVDLTNRQVTADAVVCLREGVIEFAVCSTDMKTHETPLLMSAQPKHLHLALLLAGLRPGSPARWAGDTFTPPTGDRVKITCRWQDPEMDVAEITSMLAMGAGERRILDEVAKAGDRLVLSGQDLAALKDAGAEAPLLAALKPIAEQWMARRAADRKTHEAPLRTWIRSSRQNGPAFPDAWVFAGSRTGPDGAYWADADDTVVAVSNFESAVLDIALQSSQSVDFLMWEADTDAIPPVGTKVELIFTAAEPPGPQRMTIHVATDGAMAVDGKAATAGDLERQLAALSEMDRKTILVVIEADGRTPFSHVVTVMDQLSEAGIAKIRFSQTKPQP